MTALDPVKQLKRTLLCIKLAIEETESESCGKSVQENAVIYGRDLHVTREDVDLMMCMTLEEVARAVGKKV